MELKKQAFDKYSQLAGNLDASLKTTICVFYLYNSDLNSVELCSFGSGTKAVGQNKLNYGYKLHTCHAEIIAKRGFQLWIYNAMAQTKEKYFDHTQANKLKFRSNFKLYVYISQPPCGQCSLFKDSKIYGLSAARPFINFEIPATGEVDFDANKLRSTPTNSKTPIKHRNPSYCCSDKIMMWTILGVQGSLLNLLIEPIYIECLLIDYREKFSLSACINAEIRGKCSRDAILKLNNKMISHSFKIKKPKIYYGKNKMFRQSPFHEKNDNYNKRIHESDLEQDYQSYSYLFVSPSIIEKINSLTGLKQGVAKKNENNIKLLPSISKFVLFKKYREINKIEKDLMLYEAKLQNYKYRLIKEQLLNKFIGRSTSKQALEQFY